MRQTSARLRGRPAGTPQLPGPGDVSSQRNNMLRTSPEPGTLTQSAIRRTAALITRHLTRTRRATAGLRADTLTLPALSTALKPGASRAAGCSIQQSRGHDMTYVRDQASGSFRGRAAGLPSTFTSTSPHGSRRVKCVLYFTLTRGRYSTEPTVVCTACSAASRRAARSSASWRALSLARSRSAWLGGLGVVSKG